MFNKKYITIIIAVVMVATAFIGIHYYTSATNNNLNNNNSNYKLNLKPYIVNANKNNTPEYYSISIYIENSNSTSNKFIKNPYKYNIELLNETLPFNNYNVSLNGNILKNISNGWYNYIKTKNNNQIINYIDNKNSLSMQVYAFTFLNNNNTTYVYTYFNNILYNPLNIIDNNYFNSSLNVYFNMNNPTYIYNNGNNTNPDYITPGPGSDCDVYERNVCDYNDDHSYTQELNQTTYNNSYLPVSVMYLNDTDNNTDLVGYVNDISTFNSNQTVNFQFNDTTTYSDYNTMQSTVPSYASQGISASYESNGISISSVMLAAAQTSSMAIYGIPNSILQITNYRPITIIDYKYTVHVYYYNNGKEVKETSKTYIEDRTYYGNPYATLKILIAGSSLKGFSVTGKNYTRAMQFLNYLFENNNKTLNVNVGAGKEYTKSISVLNVTPYSHYALNKALIYANLFLGLGMAFALEVALGTFPEAGEIGAVLTSLAAAAGSLGMAIVQASHPISVGGNVNWYINTLAFTAEGNNPLNFVMYNSEYPEYVEYNGTYYAVYVPEPYIYVTTP